MSFTFGITGKGGAGKTTLSALIIRWLIESGRKPVLAVDADPNMCLGDLMGVEVRDTIGAIREEAREIAGKGMSSGISKQDLLEFRIQQALREATGFDLLAMGRSEGPGCYCYANNVLSRAIDHLARGYPYLVIDNEAGLENLSRRTVQKVDVLLIVSDASLRGARTATRISGLSREMNVLARRTGLVVNRVSREGPGVAFMDLIRDEIPIEATLPEDESIRSRDENGLDIFGLEPENAVLKAVDKMMDGFLGTTSDHERNKADPLQKER